VEITNKFVSLTTMITWFVWISSSSTAEPVPSACENRCNTEKRYAGLFEHEISGYILEEISDSINKAWMLGDGRFK